MSDKTNNNSKNIPMSDDWKSHQLLVLSTMSRLEIKTDALNTKLDQLWHGHHKQDKEIDRLKTKASMLAVFFGACSGFVAKYFGG